MLCDKGLPACCPPPPRPPGAAAASTDPQTSTGPPAACCPAAGNVWVEAGRDKVDVGLCVKNAGKALYVPDFAAPLGEGDSKGEPLKPACLFVCGWEVVALYVCGGVRVCVGAP
jgi:hypothetical protein